MECPHIITLLSAAHGPAQTTPRGRLSGWHQVKCLGGPLFQRAVIMVAGDPLLSRTFSQIGEVPPAPRKQGGYFPPCLGPSLHQTPYSVQRHTLLANYSDTCLLRPKLKPDFGHLKMEKRQRREPVASGKGALGGHPSRGSVNYSPRAESSKPSLPRVFVNKDAPEVSHVHSLLDLLWLLSCYNGGVEKL